MTPTRELVERRFTAMASPVVLGVLDPGPRAPAALDCAREVFERVEAACSRFDPASALSRVNADPGRWHDVPVELAAAVTAAASAYARTAGVFDPRVIDALEALGYDRPWPLQPGAARADRSDRSDCPAPVRPPASRGPWRPRVEGTRMHLGGDRIDLGGIGKGLAVRWASRALADAGSAVLVDAGGDGWFGGTGPSGSGWRVGVEDPAEPSGEPLLVLELSDAGCATSSTRLRHWQVAGHQVHHLVDPATGRSGGAGLVAVTVVHADTAAAEVWSKTLFLAGASGIGAQAARHALAAAWVDADGRVTSTAAMDQQVSWRRTRG